MLAQSCTIFTSLPCAPHGSTRPLNLGHEWQAAGTNTRSSESSVTCWQESVPICWRSSLKSMPLQTLLMSWSISRLSARPTDWCAHHLSQGMPRRSRKVCVHSACAVQPMEHRPCPWIWKIWKIWNWLSQTWNCWWKPSLRRPKKWRPWGFSFDLFFIFFPLCFRLRLYVATGFGGVFSACQGDFMCICFAIRYKTVQRICRHFSVCFPILGIFGHPVLLHQAIHIYILPVSGGACHCDLQHQGLEISHGERANQPAMQFACPEHFCDHEGRKFCANIEQHLHLLHCCSLCACKRMVQRQLPEIWHETKKEPEDIWRHLKIVPQRNHKKHRKHCYQSISELPSAFRQQSQGPDPPLPEIRCACVLRHGGSFYVILCHTWTAEYLLIFLGYNISVFWSFDQAAWEMEIPEVGSSFAQTWKW